MKRLRIIIPIFALMLFSCEDYLDVNTSGNNPVGEQITPDLALAGAQTSSFAPFAVTANQLGNVYMGNWGANVNSFTGGFADEFSLAITNSFYTGIWNGFYRSTANFSNIINYDSEDYDHHKAISLIMRSFYFQYLVDLYGDIPYSEAHQGVNNLTPAYDDDEEVYINLMNDIDTAIEMIASAPAQTIAVGGEDVMMSGDMGRWVRFANTLKLRMLIRVSEKVESGSASAELSNAFTAGWASLSDASFIASSVTINPGYSNSRADRQNPFYGQFFEITGAETNTFRFIRAAQPAASFLNTTGDPRRSQIYATIGGAVVGVVQGDSSAPEGNAPATLSELGPGLVSSPEQDGYVMTLAESFFLQSEAVLRGYLPGDAKALFESGIAASFAQYGVSAGLAGYLSANNGVDGVGWDGSANKLEAIITQKWVALNGINGIESWIENTRTGFPEIPLALTAQRPHRPLRLMYPNSEYTANSANVPNQTQDDAFNSAPFWYVP